jgi:glutaminyl-tRNA synthetase
VENPSSEKDSDFTDYVNPNSLKILKTCKVEPSLKGACAGSRYQFERVGYFCVDSPEAIENPLIFIRTVMLRDSWAKILKKQKN